MSEGAASALTLRRLMKEYQSEKAAASSSSNTFSSNTSAPPHNSERKSSSSASKDEHILLLQPRNAEEGDLLEWTAILRGPKGGAYEGGLFDVLIQIPSTYPTKPPSMRFKSKIWHPNISWKTGEICLDVLSSQWSPAWTLSSACTAVIALLDDPEPDSPLNVDAAAVLRTGDRGAYRTMCRMHTLLHAAEK